jgi:hypothetical protein
MAITTLLILLLAAAYWILKPRATHQPTPAKIQRPSSPRTKYQAVSINSEQCGCNAVQAVSKKRFLTSGNVPGLPLANCSESTCKCKYTRHNDRRSTRDDRRAIYSMQAELYGVGEEHDRRAKRGRRTTDSASDFNYSDIQWTS